MRAIASEINAALAGFIRGQSLVCLFVGLWYGIGLTLIGLDFGFLIGVIAGVLSFIPYVGSLTALILSLGVGLVQGWPSLKLFFLALAVVGVGQFLEGNVVAPKLVGGSIGLHPVWLMFALFAFGGLFGFTGLLIAVPTAAALGVLARHLIGLYLKSPLYRGAAPSEDEIVSAPARQLTLDWPHDPSYAREDFLEAPGNAEALRAILSWPNWAGRTLMLVGPSGSGKSHLGAIWARTAAARVVAAEALSRAPLVELAAAKALLIEDADRIGAEEAALFHLLNLARESGAHLLLTARGPARRLGAEHRRSPLAASPGADRFARRAGSRPDPGRAVQIVQRPPAGGRSGGRLLCRAAHRAFARRGARDRRGARPRGFGAGKGG